MTVRTLTCGVEDCNCERVIDLPDEVWCEYDRLISCSLVGFGSVAWLLEREQNGTMRILGHDGHNGVGVLLEKSVH
jgi:hypothetical protein